MALVADDDPIFRRVVVSWMEKWDYKVVSVENGNDAWEILKSDDAPQMVIIDWMMPGMDGVEICRNLRAQEQGRYHYVLIITAKDHTQDIVAGLDAGANDYLTKPFNVDELRARVRAGKRMLELQEELLRTQEKLRFEAAHDGLTGLWNRCAILDLLRREMERHNRTRRPFGIVMADVDRFKQVNDAHGHLVGDGVLREVARRLESAVRSYDFVGRYGGEEFLIILPDCASQDLVESAERLRVQVSRRVVRVDDLSLSITLSFGAAALPFSRTGAPSYETLLQAADAALYQAKANGRNRVELAVLTQNASTAHSGK